VNIREGLSEVPLEGKHVVGMDALDGDNSVLFLHFGLSVDIFAEGDLIVVAVSVGHKQVGGGLASEGLACDLLHFLNVVTFDLEGKCLATVAVPGLRRSG